MMATQQVSKCVMCGSTRIDRTTQVTYKSGRKEIIPVCADCGHFHFWDARYVYVISGEAINWASAQDLKGVIEAILKQYLPDDVKGLSIEVTEMAD